MTVSKNKLMLGICCVGLLAGYGAAEWILPRYFEPEVIETPYKPQDVLAVWSAQKKYYRSTKTGNYLAGQFAQNRKDWEKASDYMSRVLQKETDNPDLKKHAMVLAMGAGQINRAVALAKDLMKDEQEDSLLATLFLAADNFETENYLAVEETLGRVEENSIAAFIIPILKFWAKTATGVLDIESLPEQSFYAYHVMLAGQYLNKQAKASEYAINAFDIEETDSRHLEKTADLFARSGSPETAEKIYAYMVDKGYKDEKVQEKLALLKEGESINDIVEIENISAPKDGAALVFLDMAEILLRDYSDDSATIFARMALHLNPALSEANIIIGNILARHQRLDEAIYEFKQIDKDSELHSKAQQQIADLYAEQGKEDEAIKILKSLYSDNDNVDALIQIGDIYRYKEDYQNAVKTYDKVLGLEEEIPEKYWHVLYARGMSHERLKNYKKSEEDLLKALEYRPNHPFILNYLGYSWTDQGVNLEKALNMIEKASQDKPDDGYIADSLGWVYYKMGDFESAITHLERAVELLPYDATINDHLGDAYWKVGRRLEAKFQWRRAINYSEVAEAELKTKIEEKLAHGLPEEEDGVIKTLTGVVKDVIEEKTKPSL
jgi:tetratricopeptide (TPR) repeat protein